MKHKKICYEKNYIPLYETDMLAQYFSDMSAQGKFVIDVTDERLTFRLSEPQRLRYCVDLFKPGINQTEDEYFELCSSSGWSSVSGNSTIGIYVFCSLNPETIPIQTDAQMKADCILRVSKKTKQKYIKLLLLSVIPAAMQIAGVFVSTADYSKMYLIVTAIMLANSFIYMPMLVSYTVGSRKRAAQILSGDDVPAIDYKKYIKRKIVIQALVIFIFVVAFIGLIISFVIMLFN